MCESRDQRDVRHGNTGCQLCGKRTAYTGAVFCGAACCAAWEMGQRPADYKPPSQRQSEDQ